MNAGVHGDFALTHQGNSLVLISIENLALAVVHWQILLHSMEENME